MKDLVDRMRRSMTGRPERAALDPFRTLELQARLSRLAREMDALDRSHSPPRAYDQTLAEACARAELPVPSGNRPSDRLLAEASLLQAGWTW